jgi:type IV secretory pathway component VirB8
MDFDTQKELQEQKEMLDRIYTSVEKTRKYFFWTLIISVAAIVLPLIGLAFLVPYVFSVYSSALGI